MNILILNWRDRENPDSGGAEQITHKYAEYWAKNGHSVFWIANEFNGAKKYEKIDDFSIFRVGPGLGRNTLVNLFYYPLFLLQSIYFARQIIKKNKIDLVIDEIHGLPFFTPLFVKQKKVLLVCEVAGEIWDKMWPFPINVIGKMLEKFIYWLYGNIEMWAISGNTKKDILKMNKKAYVKILPLGIDIVKRKIYEKTKYPSAIFVARLVPMKGIEVAIEAAGKIKNKLPDFKLLIIGHGTKEYEKILREKVGSFGLESVVTFLGYVSEEDKYRYLSESHFLFHPSYKEGFGLTVLEAGLVETASIVKKGSSLDELVSDGKDGYIVESSGEIANKFIESYLKNNINKLCDAAKSRSLRYSWEDKLHESIQITGI